MLQRTMLAAAGLVATLFLGGCVFKSEGRRDGYTRTHHTRVYNVQQRSYPHSHNGGTMHSHVGGNQRHGHDKAADNDRGHPGKHKGHHKQCDHRDCGHACMFRDNPDDRSPEPSDMHPPATRHPHERPGHPSHDKHDHGLHKGHHEQHDAPDDDDHDEQGDDDEQHGHGKGKAKGHDKGKGHGKGKAKGHDKD